MADSRPRIDPYFSSPSVADQVAQIRRTSTGTRHEFRLNVPVDPTPSAERQIHGDRRG